MSREPESAAHRLSLARGKAGAAPESQPAPAAPPQTPPPPARRSPRIRVEGVTKPQPIEGPGRAEMEARRRSVMTKAVMTTEALSDEERKILQGYRLALGGETAAKERARLERGAQIETEMRARGEGG